MKYVRILIFIIYFIVYGYSCHKTSTDPNNLVWGYICGFIFGFLAIWSVILYGKYYGHKKNSEDS